jgi:hypothetical protein
LQQLFDGNDVIAKEFRNNIRQYNNAFVFTSMGVNQDCTLGLGPYCLCVHRQLTHKCNVLLLEPSIQPIFAQLYVFDPYETLQARMRTNPKNAQI